MYKGNKTNNIRPLGNRCGGEGGRLSWKQTIKQLKQIDKDFPEHTARVL